MANRFSTDILKRQGSRKRVKQIQDNFTNTFQDTFGADVAAEYSNVALSDKTLTGGALNWNDFYSAKSFFNSKGLSETGSITLALLMIDVSKTTGVSVMKLIQPLKESPQIIFDLETYAVLNFLRPQSSKQNVMVRNNNRNSLRKRNIVA